jgi:hypothetical protein
MTRLRALRVCQDIQILFGMHARRYTAGSFDRAGTNRAHCGRLTRENGLFAEEALPIHPARRTYRILPVNGILDDRRRSVRGSFEKTRTPCGGTKNALQSQIIRVLRGLGHGAPKVVQDSN